MQQHSISASCPPFEQAESPAAQTAMGCLCILAGIVGQLELFAVLTRRQWIPIVFARKMAHIGSGSLMTSALVLFPRQYWPARLAVSLFLVCFMLVFATIAHLPDDRFASLPPLLRGRLESMVHAMCRTGERSELMRGTFYYAFAVACFVLLFWSAPINAIVFASLFVGDGVADPIGRLITSWLGAPRCVRARPPALERPPAASGSGGATRRASRSGAAAAPGSADALAAAAEEAAPDALPPPRRGDGGEGGPSGGKGDGGKGVAKPLLPLQYQVFYFGVKSVPGSLAFFVGSLAAALGWAALFRAAGHYGPDFSMAAFAAAAALCIGVATVAEAISPPHVDNLLVTYAAAASAFCLSESGVAPFLLLGCA